MRNHKYFIITLNEFLDSESKQRNAEVDIKSTAYTWRLYIKKEENVQKKDDITRMEINIFAYLKHKAKTFFKCFE